MCSQLSWECEAKRIRSDHFEDIAPAVIAAGLATEDDINALGSELETFVQNSETIVSFPRIFKSGAIGAKRALCPVS